MAGRPDRSLLWITHRLDELATTAVAAPAAHNRPVFIHRPDSGAGRMRHADRLKVAGNDP